MEENVRQKKEDIVKDKLGNEEIDLSGIDDDNLDKAITTEDKENLIKKETGAEDLDIENLPEDQVDSLLGHITKQEESTEVDEIDTLVETLCEENKDQEEIEEALENKFGLKQEEAENVYKVSFNEKDTYIDKLYDAIKESEDPFKAVQGIAIARDDERDNIQSEEPVKIDVPENVDHVEDLKDQTGEKIGKKIEEPEVVYANKEEAKSTPDPIDL